MHLCDLLRAINSRTRSQRVHTKWFPFSTTIDTVGRTFLPSTTASLYLFMNCMYAHVQYHIDCSPVIYVSLTFGKNVDTCSSSNTTLSTWWLKIFCDVPRSLRKWEEEKVWVKVRNVNASETSYARISACIGAAASNHVLCWCSVHLLNVQSWDALLKFKLAPSHWSSGDILGWL